MLSTGPLLTSVLYDQHVSDYQISQMFFFIFFYLIVEINLLLFFSHVAYNLHSNYELQLKYTYL